MRSPSTKYVDIGLKRLAFADAGLEWYWLVDPDEPSISVLRNVDGTFEDFARAAGNDTLTLHEPFEFSYVPQEMLRNL